MTPTELRIGNWVHTGGFHVPKFQGFHQVEAEWIEYAATFIPILLTAAILEKAGFEYEHDQIGMTYRIKNFVMFFDGEGIGRNFGMDSSDDERLDVNCKYLHELQNLYFALTKKELEINF